MADMPSIIREGKQGRTHIKFGDNGTTTVEKGREIPPGEVETYRRLEKIPRYAAELNWLEEGWRTSITMKDQTAATEAIAARVGHKEFIDLHHTLSKSFIENLDAISDNQRKILENKLDRPLIKGNRALSNLYSNLCVGPLYSHRTDDPGYRLDATYYQVEGKEYSYLRMDPISEEYQKLYNFFEKIKQEGRNVATLPDKEFIDNIANPLERAEKKQVVLNAGYRINQNVSMWKKLNNNTWAKVPIPITEREWETRQILVVSYVSDYSTLSALKRLFPAG